MKSNISLRQFLILLVISIIFIFGFIKIETDGIKIVPQSYGVLLKDDIVLALENRTFWPIRYPKCNNQNIDAQLKVVNGWKEIEVNSPCENLPVSHMYDLSFHWLWPFQTKTFKFSPKDHHFTPGTYVFGLWTDTTFIRGTKGFRASIFVAQYNNFI